MVGGALLVAGVPFQAQERQQEDVVVGGVVHERVDGVERGGVHRPLRARREDVVLHGGVVVDARVPWEEPPLERVPLAQVVLNAWWVGLQQQQLLRLQWRRHEDCVGVPLEKVQAQQQKLPLQQR